MGQARHLSLRTDARSAKPSWHVDWVVLEPEPVAGDPAAGGLPLPPATPLYFVGRCWLGPTPQVSVRFACGCNLLAFICLHRPSS